MTRIALFDLGNVIARWNPSLRFAEYARRCGLTPAQVEQRLATDALWSQADRGVLSGDEMHARLCALLGCALSREDAHRFQALAFCVDPEALALAEAVARRLRTGLLTNNAPLLHEALPRFFPEVARVFDPILFSSQLGHVKPEPKLFHAVQARLGIAPGEILFIDDTASHVRAAAASGWDAVQYTSARELRELLVERGILERGPIRP